MERPKNSRVRHGMASCARYGCRLDICMNAQRRAYRDRDPDGARVSTDKAASHIEQLFRANMTLIDISNRSGVSTTQIRLIFQRKSDRILRVNSEAILGVEFPDSEYFPKGDGLVSPIGSSRRLRALTVQGFSIGYMSKKSGLTARTVGIIRSCGRGQIRASRMHRITRLHDTLWDLDPLSEGMLSGAATRAKQHAERNKWWPSEAWADIDNPDCKPSLKTPRYVILMEDSRELLRVRGNNKQNVAKRLGVPVNTLDKAIGYYNAKAS